MDVAESLVSRIHSSFTAGVHFATPVSSLSSNELDLVRGVLQMLQGLSSNLFYWDDDGQCFRIRNGLYVTHLSRTSLYSVLDRFIYAGTCLRIVDIVVHKIEKSTKSPPPTLRAFACSVSTWIRRLRDVALNEEAKICSSGCKTMPTLLGLSSSLSSVCAGAEYLWQVVHGAIPQKYFEIDHYVAAADIAVHILNFLYLKLTEVCLVQGGEEDGYRMLFYIFVGSLLPYIECLDSWLFEGTLDDPFEEMFFYANKGITIDESDFWEKSYLPRSANSQTLHFPSYASDLLHSAKEKQDMAGRVSISRAAVASAKEANKNDFRVCPLFMRNVAKTIVSAGKSLQLIRHAPVTSLSVGPASNYEIGNSIAGLTLSEVFSVSLAALIGNGNHLSEHFWKENKTVSSSEFFEENRNLEKCDGSLLDNRFSNQAWHKFLVDTLAQKKDVNLEYVQNSAADFVQVNGCKLASDEKDKRSLLGTCLPENPAMTVCLGFLRENRDAWNTLNISEKFYLPPLNDEGLRRAIFGEGEGTGFAIKSTDYTCGFQFGEQGFLHSLEDTKMLEVLFPFPTLLPPFEENLRISEVLPFQNNSTLPSKVLSWIESAEPKCNPHPAVVLQECLLMYIKKQADHIGRNMLSKLLHDWRLLDELGVLRAIYLLGSGDLLHHFFTVIFNKLDKGESLDDEFELNTILQESIRYSADGVLLSTPDSLVVSMTKSLGLSEDEQHNKSIPISTPRKGRGQSFGMDVLDSLKFTYTVSWPLELIANIETMKKYNQVMGFLLRVKRAKFVLDKARRWMWKDRGTATTNRKRHWLLEQKLLHFVDAFHQYVMDRVYHNAWRELCEAVAAAGTLDEAIEAHETYLLSVQRQCFVVPDKLGGLIANRINSILGLALDFYSVQQTLSSSGTVSAIKARCEMEVDRIERQFDDCIAFLLRILSFKLNVGQFPHLADLVTRINYNFFYMSDSGSLVTGPGSGASSSNLGKAFQPRTD